MASTKWIARCNLGPNSGIQEVEVRAVSMQGVREQLKRVYGVTQIYSIQKVHDEPSSRESSRSSSSSEGSGLAGLAVLGVLGWAFVSFTPWVMMFIGGGVATWIGQLMVGQTLEEYNEREDNSGHGRVAIVLALALIAGGFGYYKGVEVQQYLNTPSSEVRAPNKK